MKVWMAPGIRKSNHYALRMAGGILGIMVLALALIGGSVFLMFYFEPWKEVISVIMCLLATVLVIWLALRRGRKSQQEATFFVRDEEGRLFVLDARDYVKSRRGLLGYAGIAADTQRQIEKIKEYLNHKGDLSETAVRITSVESIKENHDEYVLICHVCFPGGQRARRTYFLVKGYEQEEDLLWTLEQIRHREQAWEYEENKKPAIILFCIVLFGVSAAVCVLSHPAVGILAGSIYFPCLGIAFLLLCVMVYFIIKQRRGE
ncbi:MAG: hypothetical protein ACOX8H_02050 [Ruminococcus sp.]|jgi:hypothetical protein